MKKQSLYVFGIIAFWVISILGYLYVNQVHRMTGDIYYFKVEPIDPRDTFRGYYANLNYAELGRLNIQQENTNSFRLAQKLNSGDKIYVKLNISKDGYLSGFGWSEISKSKPLNKPYILGKVKAVYRYGDSINVQVDYGIESFFSTEKTARMVELYRGDSLFAKVRINDDGSALLESLVIDGEEIK